MTTLKHLAMAVMAFLLTTAGFLHFLQQVLPPEQVLDASRSSDASGTAAPAAVPGPGGAGPAFAPMAEEGGLGTPTLPDGVDVDALRRLMEDVDPAQVQEALRRLGLGGGEVPPAASRPVPAPDAGARPGRAGSALPDQGDAVHHGQ